MFILFPVAYRLNMLQQVLVCCCCISGMPIKRVENCHSLPGLALICLEVNS